MHYPGCNPQCIWPLGDEDDEGEANTPDCVCSLGMLFPPIRSVLWQLYICLQYHSCATPLQPAGSRVDMAHPRLRIPKVDCSYHP